MELAQQLCDAFGPAGREDRVRMLIFDEIKGYCEKIETDCLGNLIAYKPATGTKEARTTEKLMLCAHMDEIGLIVTHVDEGGFLRFTNVGGVHKNIVHQRVMFENGVLGIIGQETKSGTPHPPLFDNLFIDIGARNKAEAQEKVRIGDIAAFQQHAGILNRRFVGKALDDRIGCYCLIQTLKQLSNHGSDIYFVFSVQEEIGLRGARTGAYAIGPTCALAVDVTDTGDTPESTRMAVSIGKGVAIKAKDGAFISNPHIKNTLIVYAEDMKIPYQVEILEKGTTDASVIQLVRGGIPSGVLSIPTRYVHSTSEVCDPSDIEWTIQLLRTVCERGLPSRL